MLFTQPYCSGWGDELQWNGGMFVLAQPAVQTFHCSNFPKWALHIHLYIMLDSGHSTFRRLKQKTTPDKIGFSNMLDLPPLSTGRIPIYLGGSGEQFSCLGSFRICLHWRQPQYICANKYPPTNMSYKFPLKSIENTFKPFGISR